MENFKLIPLGSSGKFAIVDEEDFAYLSLWKWHISSTGYAIRKKEGCPESGKKTRKVIFMHRVINQTPEKLDTDHINQNRLDNRKCNLRTATRSENNRNTPLHPNNTSGCSGVTWIETRKKWEAKVSVNGKGVFLGHHKEVDDAIKAVKEFRKSLKCN